MKYLIKHVYPFPVSRSQQICEVTWITWLWSQNVTVTKRSNSWHACLYHRNTNQFIHNYQGIFEPIMKKLPLDIREILCWQEGDEWGYRDLWPLISKKFILEAKWRFVSVELQIYCLEGQMETQTYKNITNVKACALWNPNLKQNTTS